MHIRIIFSVLCLSVFAVPSGQAAESAVQALAKQHQTAIAKRLRKTNETLYEALAQAHENNPTLQAALSEMEAVEEGLQQARSGYLPSVSADGDITHTDTEVTGTGFVPTRGSNVSTDIRLSLDQNLFTGGSTRADIRAAKYNISAQMARLSETEQKLLYDAVVAYMDVLQNHALVELNENNRALVSKELEQTRDRFRVGELTRTDVSQAEARAADARAGVIRATGTLKSSIATYRQIVGEKPPEDMAYPVMRLDLPQTVEEALNIARTNNRSVLAAKFDNAASEENVDSIYGELMPQVKLQGSVGRTYDPQDGIDEQDQSRIGVAASIPLYQSGSIRSRAREAKRVATQRLHKIREAENQALQETRSHWEDLVTARAEIAARQAQVDAAAVAREGAHYETELGERTTLDALDANQEYLDAQVNLITAKRNEVVAKFALARSLGILTPTILGIKSDNP